MPNIKFPFPQQGSNTFLGVFQKSTGIVFSISSTNLTGVGISALFFFSSIVGIKCFAIKSRNLLAGAML